MITVCSLWGSPGVTRSSYAISSELLRISNKHVLLAECDPSGGDLAVWLGQPTKPGIASFAPSLRRGQPGNSIWNHVQESKQGVGLLLAPSCAEQFVAIGNVLNELGRHVAKITEVEVVVDLGRLQPGLGFAKEFIELSSLVLVCLRADRAHLVNAAQRMPFLAQANPKIFAIVLGNGPYTNREVEEGISIPVLGRVQDIDTDINLWRTDSDFGAFDSGNESVKLLRRKSQLGSAFEKIAAEIQKLSQASQSVDNKIIGRGPADKSNDEDSKRLKPKSGNGGPKSHGQATQIVKYLSSDLPPKIKQDPLRSLSGSALANRVDFVTILSNHSKDTEQGQLSPESQQESVQYCYQTEIRSSGAR